MASVVRPPVVIGLVAMSLTWGLGTISRYRVLDIAEGDSRYVTVARHVARTFPAQAVFLSVLHSGSLRYYAGRETLRFAYVAPEQLEKLPQRLSNHGRPLYFVLENWEEPLFRECFASTTLGALDWPPMAELRVPVVVRIYDPADRPRHLKGETVVTFAIQ